MVTHKPQQQQSRSVAKRIWFAALFFLSVVSSYGQEITTIAGAWIIRFGNGVERVYRISADGSFSFADAGESKEGKVLTENGQFVIRLADGRVQRVSKLSETVLKVEAFASQEAFAAGKVRTAGTGRLESPSGVPAAQTVPTKSTRTLTLAATWNTPLQAGANTQDDLSKLFGTLATAKTDLGGNDGILLYQNIPYLTPVREAVAALKLDPRMMSKVLIACPGLPRDSFYYYGFDGRFEGSFNRLNLVVDRADQLVSVQLVEESPKTKAFDLARDHGWHTYNLINARTKATNTLKIGHRVAIGGQGKWIEPRHNAVFVPEITPQNASWTIARVDSVLAESDPKSPGRLYDLGAKEASRWYIPRPIVELILTCVQQSGR